MASPTQWTWVWVDSGSWWWTGRHGVLLFIVSQRVRHDWVTELNWTVPLLGCKDKVGRGLVLTRIVVFLGKLDRQKLDAPREEKTVVAQGVEAEWRRECGKEGQWRMNGAKGPELLMWLDGGWSTGIRIRELGDRRWRSSNEVLKVEVSVQFNCSVLSDTLWTHELQHARPPCPSQIPGVYSNSCP